MCNEKTITPGGVSLFCPFLLLPFAHLLLDYYCSFNQSLLLFKEMHEWCVSRLYTHHHQTSRTSRLKHRILFREHPLQGSLDDRVWLKQMKIIDWPSLCARWRHRDANSSDYFIQIYSPSPRNLFRPSCQCSRRSYHHRNWAEASRMVKPSWGERIMIDRVTG